MFYHTVLPTFREEGVPSAIPAPDVTKVALRLKYLIEEVIPCELKESHITTPHGKIITKGVIKAAQAAGGKDFGACVVYCLLVNKRWFKKQAMLELWDADLHELRAIACEVIAKEMCVQKPEGCCRADENTVSSAKMIKITSSKISSSNDMLSVSTAEKHKLQMLLNGLLISTPFELLAPLVTKSVSITFGVDG